MGKLFCLYVGIAFNESSASKKHDSLLRLIGLNPLDYRLVILDAMFYCFFGVPLYTEMEGFKFLNARH